MKFFCTDCGVHFPKDFNKTLEPQCNFWGDRKLTNLPIKYKKMLWDWLSLMPADAIFVATKIQVNMIIKGASVESKDTFAVSVPNWEKMTEGQRQAYEKIHFKALQHGKQLTHKEIMKQLPKKKKEFVN